VVAPDVLCEGESRGSTQPPENIQLQGSESVSLKRKQPEEDELIDLDALQKTCRKHIDYWYLNDPFPDEDGLRPDDLIMQSCIHTTNAMTHSEVNEPQSLREARGSSEWPEWEHAVKTELDQLREKGTWILIKKPADVTPITNRWVFTKKFNKDGDLLKYKGRSVVKGCVQRPGQDYTETFAPVVWLETVRAILALAAIKDLHIRQMDVKGAYLNRILKEKVYMHQLEGYDDETGRCCLLIKTLYGLKQAGQEWNNELDQKLKKHRFSCLCSDPCT
jgi:hypothetical protein